MPIKAEFIERKNRFTATAKLNNEIVEVHVPNSGRMKELLESGAEVYLHRHEASHRKTHFDLALVRYNGFLVSIDSRVPNKIIIESIKKGLLEEFKDYKVVRGEVKYGNSRLDLLLEKDDKKCYVEIKSVTLVNGRTAMFPDAPTPRGARHLRELAGAVEEGNESAVVFLVQREDADNFTPNGVTDPDFAKTLKEVKARGVKIYAYTCRVDIESIEIVRSIPVVL